jgi:hypothetical protein
MRIRNIVICDLPGYRKFSTLYHERNDFRGEKKVIEY